MSLRQRDPRDLESPYLKWVRLLPCVGCAVAGRHVSPCEAAHVKMGIASHGWREHGLQERSHDRHAVGLCDRCHRVGPTAQHNMGERKFWDRLGICPACLADELSRAYDAGESGGKVIWDFVRRARIKALPACCLES